MDDVDRSQVDQEFSIKEALRIHFQKDRARKSIETPSFCVHCEENPVALLSNGASSQYCERCAAELL